MTPPTIAPFPTESDAISQNEEISVGGGRIEEHSGRFVYGGAIGFSIGLIVSDPGRLGVEEPINYYPTVDVLRRARRVEEYDFPVGSPFGA
jgi:hypothetical protein